MPKFPIEDVPGEFLFLAQDYHGGQWSSFYSLSSTGKIHTEEHLLGLAAETRQLLRIGVEPEDIDNMVAFEKYLESVEESLNQ